MSWQSSAASRGGVVSRRAFIGSGAALGAGWIARGPFASLGSLAPLDALGSGRSLMSPVSLAVPSASQLAWQRDELAMFLHFGVNTFTDREWGDGREDPALFAPTQLDARQWARVARAAGFRAMIITAKHHDGFCLWPSATTEHTVARSAWRGGNGDVVRELVDACRAEGLRAGVYLSPWDRNNPSYGDTPRYNELYAAQLTELLTRYGPIAEVWFDGANGEGPNGKRQVYDWPRVHALVRRLQPDAVMFSDAGPDLRWCGNERGTAGDPNWSPVDPRVVTYPGQSGPGVDEALQHGHANGTAWRPAEVDVSIRRGWFHHPAEDDSVRSADNLVELYFTSVGRNAKLLLNVPPTRAGLLHDTDVAHLLAFRGRLDEMRSSLVPLTSGSWRRASSRSAVAEWSVPRAATLAVARLAEDVAHGQRVARYALYGLHAERGAWQVLSHGSTIGYAKLDRVAQFPVRRVRLVIEDAVAPPAPVRLELYARS